MRSVSMKTSQQGAALLVSLMILLIISLIGVTAMKTSMFNTKIATSAQAVSMAFQGAESGLEQAVEEAKGALNPDSASLLKLAFQNYEQGVTTPVPRCVTSGGVKLALCQGTDFFDGRSLVKSYTKTLLTGWAELDSVSSQVSQGSAGAAQLVRYEFMSGGVGTVPLLNVQQVNVQEYVITAFFIPE